MEDIQVGDRIKLVTPDGEVPEVTVVPLSPKFGTGWVKLRFPDSHFEIWPADYLLARAAWSARVTCQACKGGGYGRPEAKHQVPSFQAESSSSDFGSAGPADLNALSGVEFEKLITTLLGRMGFRAEMTKATGDGGVDIVAAVEGPIVGGKYLFQCKRFAPDHPVGVATVREFYGVLAADRRAVKGILVTTSGFTAQAREFAQNVPVELVDGNQLGRLLAQYRR
jgi:hypothetical protein